MTHNFPAIYKFDNLHKSLFLSLCYYTYIQLSPQVSLSVTDVAAIHLGLDFVPQVLVGELLLVQKGHQSSFG